MRILLFLISIFYAQTAFSQNAMFDICPLKVGEEIPDVSIANDKKESIPLSNVIGDKPTVIVFYRGAWCGYCTKHLAELNDIENEIELLGYQIIGVTVDQADKLEESSSRAETEIEVYSDSKLEAINAFGLDWKLDDTLFEKYKTKFNLDLEEWSGEAHHSLPVPSIYVIKENKVAFQYVNPNYKVRLKPETLLAILQTL